MCYLTYILQKFAESNWTPFFLCPWSIYLKEYPNFKPIKGYKDLYEMKSVYLGTWQQRLQVAEDWKKR